MSISRRSFLESIPLGSLAAQAAMATAIDPKTGMPTRVLGKTGARVSILAMGCGSRLLSYNSEEKAVEAIHRALEAGVTYLDTAYSYGNGRSESWVGKAIQGRRKGLWITTKIQERNGGKAMAIFEGSLKRLGVDQVDLVHVHGLGDAADLESVQAAGGVLEVLYKLRDQKMARFIGVTSHSDPATLRDALKNNDFDCVQMALNAALVGMENGKNSMVINRKLTTSFETLALPVALKKKMGVTAMKVYAQEGLINAAPLDKLFSYALSLPVAAAVTGMPKLEFIGQNAAMAKSFKPMSKGEMKDLAGRLSREHKARLDGFFRGHVDA